MHVLFFFKLTASFTWLLKVAASPWIERTRIRSPVGLLSREKWYHEPSRGSCGWHLHCQNDKTYNKLAGISFDWRDGAITITSKNRQSQGAGATILSNNERQQTQGGTGRCETKPSGPIQSVIPACVSLHSVNRNGSRLDFPRFSFLGD